MSRLRSRAQPPRTGGRCHHENCSECSALQCAANCSSSDLRYSWRFGRWLEPLALNGRSGQYVHWASTGISRSHFVTRRVGFFIKRHRVIDRITDVLLSRLNAVTSDPASIRIRKLLPFFVKRIVRTLHYSGEWKKSQRVTTAAHLRSRHGRAWHRGEVQALPIAGTERGSGSGDLRGFSKYQSILVRQFSRSIPLMPDHRCDSTS